ncbi:MULTISPECIES: B12-binding domain-containing radical SAM protein [unclassified Fusibacter]|uniref:B12-binding domain-containing radical SAM protein n=1 Tax=unclassified Fusibacter TaxID=2624464 RepID=UPI0010135363|nr:MULTISPECIES: radical SAM protein [unclassified Fusibacter]MCK8058717.1 B12-binding domain-containing radical SAM protein [Fusibacter sp. A2]NPE21791.1 B12-binding domain-containing radical SAM protein [Fusibacter sp. A1]RXV61364.1 radical SAM protein [Fusibacter sp. A1]
MKKKLLMITPENKEINAFRKRQFNNFVQLTMPYLAAYVDEDQYEITLVDEYNQKIPYEKTFDLIAITVNTPNAIHCYEMARRLMGNGSKIVLGGPHATLLPFEAQQYCDFILIGEGEEIWPRFLNDFYHDRAKESYECTETPSLSKIPDARRDLITGRYLTKGAVFASRGCTHHCAYCNLKQIYCKEYRTRPIDEVIKEIEHIKSKYFVFWDDDFWGDTDHAKKLMVELIKLNKKWAAQVTLDTCIDDSLLKLAKESGCMYLFLGIESFSTQGLTSVNKTFNRVEDYEAIIKKIHNAGIAIQAGIIFGFDTDDKDVFKRTLEACENLGIDGATVSILTPFPRTPLHKKLLDEGRLKDVDWSHYNAKTRVTYLPKNMTEEELLEGFMWFRKKFYSFGSIIKRLKVSKTNIIHNLIINIGYKISR